MRVRIVLAGLTALALSACSQPAPPPAAPPPAAAPATAPAPAPAPATGPVAPPTTEADMIKSAMSAGPETVVKDATVVAVDDKGMRTLRPGTNGWTCIPDSPSPGVDPMCLDKNGMEWAMAWMNHKDPPKDKIGFAYMLAGGSDASNTDPFATKPNPSDKWIETGPHVMILNIADRFTGYPTTPGDAKSPYIMFPNTPYAHLMIPVR